MYDDTLVTRYAGVDPPVPMVQADALKEKILYLTKELAQKDRELQVAANFFALCSLWISGRAWRMAACRSATEASVTRSAASHQFRVT